MFAIQTMRMPRASRASGLSYCPTNTTLASMIARRGWMTSTTSPPLSVSRMAPVRLGVEQLGQFARSHVDPPLAHAADVPRTAGGG